MAFWLAHANFNLPYRQAAKLDFLAPHSVIRSVCLPILITLSPFLPSKAPILYEKGPLVPQGKILVRTQIIYAYFFMYLAFFPSACALFGYCEVT